MKYETALELIFSLKQLGMKLGLENVQNFLNHLNNPEKHLNSIHIAGSNGKGSTLSFISSILMESGYKVGFFTSPHLVDFAERIRINGQKISHEYITDFVEKYLDWIENKKITFFEISTAMAFKYFEENKVDFAVIETGLGGRLDATNLMNSKCSVITTISLEHTNILGSTIKEIAREKAGIIKPNSKSFLGYLNSEAKNEISEIAIQQKSQIFEVEQFSVLNSESIRINFKDLSLNLYKTGFLGFHQLKNAALASVVVKEILPNIEIENLLNGIENVKENTGLRGRFEVYSQNPLIIFDAGHNLEGISAFIKSFKSLNHNCKKKIIIYGGMKDKSLHEILELLKQNFDEFYFTSIDFYRAATIHDLLTLGKSMGIEAFGLENPAEFISNFNQKDECLIVLGSIYILGEILEKLPK